MYALPAALALLWLVARRARETDAAYGCAVLLMNWAINTVFVEVTGQNYPWLIFAAVDFVSALMLFSHLWLVPHAKPLLVPMAIYGVQLLLHCAWGWSDKGRSAEYHYYWFLFYAAWGQALWLGGWLGYGLASAGGPARGDRGLRHFLSRADGSRSESLKGLDR